MKHIETRWFSLADLAVVSIGSFLWFFHPPVGWKPLALVLLPWVIRLVSGRSPFQRTYLDIAAAVFLLTAFVGALISYDPEVAWIKFWLILASIFLFYALAGQPRTNLWPVAGLISVFSLAAAVYFLLTHDWQAHPVKFGAFDQITRWFVSVRPPFQAPAVHPNVAASLMAMTLPFTVAIGYRALLQRQIVFVVLIFFGISLTAFALLLTTSRGAWLASGIAIGFWLLWSINGYIADYTRQRRALTFVLLLLLLCGSGFVLAWVQADNLVALASGLLGPAGTGNRLELMRSTLTLVKDFSFTGSGLGTFSGLYSQYILVIPHNFIGHSHNLFLNVALEQGLMGFLALVFIFLVCIRLLFARMQQSGTSVVQIDLLCWATITGLLVVIVHGLVDDTLYGRRGSPVLFLLAGVGAAIVHSETRQVSHLEQFRLLIESGRRFWFAVALTATVSLLLMYTYWQPLLAQWYADLGAVRMARAELVNWPTGQWDDGRNVDHLRPAEDLLHHSLTFNPTNQTAHYRLGLIAMLRRDFPTAVAHLEKAHQLSEGHRGIIKNLGYSYVWAGRLDEAAALLVDLPESRQEMNVYTWWWTTQGRDDLSALAARMATRLNRT